VTAFSKVRPVQFHAALDGLKRRNAGHKLFTNYFLQPLDEAENFRMLESQESLCFVFDEWDFARFHFCTFNALQLATELQDIKWPPIVVADWISKDGSISAESLLTGAGFHLHAIYDRILYKNLRSEHTNTQLKFADPAERESIHALLFRVFDKYTDHIMSLAELDELISREQVIVSRDTHSAINGLVILPTNGQNCNFNFLYNSGGALNLSHLLGNFYGVLTERGIQAGFSWVRRTRPQVLKLHQSFGWKKDGLVDYIYMR
jgi:hypothetical protein